MNGHSGVKIFDPNSYFSFELVVEYSASYRQEIPPNGGIGGRWDVFLSAFNPSDRVLGLFDRIDAERKIWLLHSEYGIPAGDVPCGAEIFQYEGLDEAGFCAKLLTKLPSDLERLKLAIDVTGFMRPHMMCLVGLLEYSGMRELDVFYSEPVTYTRREATQFSKGEIMDVRQVNGLEGYANHRSSDDLMVIGAGYDHRLVSEVAQHKDAAQKVVMFGFPPLRADMYQQNLLRASRSWNALGDPPRRRRYFAPANDPFVTAEVLHDIVASNGGSKITNLYLSPLATKAQALGFVLFYVVEKRESNSSIIFPFSSRYETRTGSGLSRTWQYVLDFRTLGV